MVKAVRHTIFNNLLQVIGANLEMLSVVIAELARKAQQKIPGIAVLFTTGYADNAAMHNDRLDGGVNVIAKPYARDEVGRNLRQILRKRE